MEVWEVEGTQASPWEIIDAHEIVHALIGRGCARSIAPVLPCFCSSMTRHMTLTCEHDEV